MRSYTLIAPAKINLYLEILGDRPDGYHELAMIMQSISLADRIELRAIGTDDIVVNCDHPQVPCDRTNLAYKAVELMAARFPNAFAQYGGVQIAIQKNIPIGAGLAGGSTNGAATLVGIDLMWKLGLTQSELQELAAVLGSDVPFCIGGGTAIATGRGEALAPLPTLDALHLVLAKYYSISVSTPWAYRTYREQFKQTYVSGQSLVERRQRVHSGGIVSAIARQDGAEIGNLLHNDLEKVVLPEHPKVAHLKATLQSFDSLGVMMSGSGPTVFALAASAEQAQQLQHSLRAAIPDPDLEIWTAQTISSGIQIA